VWQKVVLFSFYGNHLPFQFLFGIIQVTHFLQSNNNQNDIFLHGISEKFEPFELYMLHVSGLFLPENSSTKSM